RRRGPWLDLQRRGADRDDRTQRRRHHLLIGSPPRVTIHDVMAILKVARLGHPVLRQQAEPVAPADIRSAHVQQLIDDMIETMHEYDGVGLAANQVHVPRRIAVIEVGKNPRYPDAPEIPLTVVINPVVTPLTEETEDGWEGCLSVPDMRGVVPRYTGVRLECLDREGKAVDLVAKEFFARVLQHETDHLNGIVYVD